MIRHMKNFRKTETPTGPVAADAVIVDAEKEHLRTELQSLKEEFAALRDELRSTKKTTSKK